MFVYQKEIEKLPPGVAIQLRIVRVLNYWQNAFLRINRWLLYSRHTENPGQKILIFRTGSIGDSVCAIPAIHAVRKKFPQATIHVLTNAGKRNLVGLQFLLNPADFDGVIDYLGYSKRELIKRLKAGGYSLVIQLPQVDASFLSLLRDLWVFRLIAPSGFGWQRAQSKLFRRTQSRYVQFTDERKRLLGIMEEQGFNGEEPSQLLQPSKDDLAAAVAVFEKLGLKKGDPIMAVVVGAKRPQNRWPINYFKQLVSHFSDRYKILLIGSVEDGQLVQSLVNLPSVHNACGMLTPLQSAAALELCTLTISNDTGPMHLSYGVGTPTVALFSSRDLPGKWYPPANKHLVFRAKNIHCEGCFSETCNNNICMQSILPEHVIEAVEKMLVTLSLTPH